MKVQVYATQGGGYAIEEYGVYRFVEPPGAINKGVKYLWSSLQSGNVVPSLWSVTVATGLLYDTETQKIIKCEHNCCGGDNCDCPCHFGGFDETGLCKQPCERCDQ